MARGQLLDPGGRVCPSLDVQAFEVSIMVHFETVAGTAHLAGVGQQTCHGLAASAVPDLFGWSSRLPTLALRAREMPPHCATNGVFPAVAFDGDL